MKLIKSILIVLFIVSVVNFVPYFTPIVSADNGKIWAEKTISAYIEARKLDIYPNTDKYNTFLKGVLLGDVPELTKAPSVYVKNDMEVQYIMEYAAQNYQSQQELLFSTIAEESSFEAIPSTQEKLSSNSLSQTGSSICIFLGNKWWLF